MDARGVATVASSIQISPTRTHKRRPFTTVGVGKGSVPTSPTYSKQAWPIVMKRAMAESNLAPYIAYSTPNSVSVDHWKKLAKKAELEFILERDSHRADNTKNNITIHRINRRLIPLEKALGRTKESLKQQEKVINHLKSQLMGADERKNTDLSYLRSQSEALQKKLATITMTSEHKILKLQEEVHQADSRAQTLQEQLNQIYLDVDEAPESDGYATREDSPEHKINSGKDGQQPNNKQQRGLVVLQKIHKMRLSKEQFKSKLRDNDEQLILLAQDNERLRKLAQGAISRSNKFMDLAQTLKVDRDLILGRLKETEDILKSLESLKDLVHSYTFLHDAKTTISPRQGNFLPGALVYKPAYLKQEVLKQSKDKKPEDVSPSSPPAVIGTTDLAVVGAGARTKVVYIKDVNETGVGSIGASLLKNLQEVFQLLAVKVETANRAILLVKQEREEIRSTMFESYRELKGERSLKINATNDFSQEVLIGIRELKQNLEGLKKEKALLKASGSKEDEKFMQLQSQVHDLSLDRMALLETLESVKSTIRASSAGQGAMQYVKGFFNRRVIQGEDIFMVLDMVEKLVMERNEAKSMGGALKEDKFLKEKELSDLRKLYAQSQTLVTHLQVEKDLLKRERNELKTTCQDLTKEKSYWEAEQKGETDKKILELQSQVHDLVLDRTSLLETLHATKNAIRASNSGQGALQYLKGFLSRSVVEGENVSEVVEMVEELVTEKEEAKLAGKHALEEREKKDRELDEIKTLYAESQTLCTNLQKERDSLACHFSELKNTANVLKTQKESFNASSLEMERKLLELQTQVRDLTLDNTAFLETLQILKNILRASNSGGVTQQLKGSIHKSTQGEDISELLSMAEKVLNEMNEARSVGRQLKEEKEMREKEFSDLTHLYSQSKSLCSSLQTDKDELEREMKELQDTFKSLEGTLDGVSRPAQDVHGGRRNPLKSGSLTLENLVNEVSAIKEKLDGAKDEFLHQRKMFERKIQEMNFVIGKQDHPLSDWESEAVALVQSLKVLKAEMEQSSAALRECRELHGVMQHQIKNLLEIMMGSDEKIVEDSHESQPSTSEPLIFQQDIMMLASDFKRGVSDLPDLIKQVQKLKREKDKLVANLLSVQLEKDAALRRSSEDQDKILKLTDGSQQEVNELRFQLNSVQSFVSYLLPNVQQMSLLEELEAIKRELLALRANNSNLEVTVSELQSQGDLEEAKVYDLANKLSLAEVQVESLSAQVLAADSRVQCLESQYAAAGAQLSELFGILVSKDPGGSSGVKSSSSDMQTVGTDIVTNIEAIKNKVFELQLAVEELSKSGKEATKWKAKVESLEKEGTMSRAEVEKLKEKLCGQGEFIKKHTAEWMRVVESLKGEIVRLGGSDPRDEGEKLRKATAAEQVKELIAQALMRNPPVPHPQTSMDTPASRNPLLSLATFQVDLLVNKKVHSQFKVAGHNGGLCQAVLHYFDVDARTGDVTFDNATVPGSQSSNLVVDLLLLPADGRKGYQSQAGDILGICIKMSTFDSSSPKEVLSNANIVRTDEVMEAIHGQMIQNFSLWPDLVSSWRWEQDVKKKKWSLVSVRWRGLLKNVFPELSDPLQALTIKGGGHIARSSSIHIL